MDDSKTFLRLRDWLTYEEAARELGLSPGSIRVYAARGVFDRRYIGGEYPMLSRKTVRAYKLNRKEPGNPDWKSKKRKKKKELAT